MKQYEMRQEMHIDSESRKMHRGSGLFFIYGSLAVLILLLGFFLPGSYLNIQDTKLETQINRYELNSVTLDFNGDILKKLSAMNESFVTMDIQKEELNLTEDMVLKEMLAVCDTFIPRDSMDRLGEIETWEANPLLIVSKDLSFAVWNCQLLYPMGMVDVFIDDATGKMLFYDFFLDSPYDSVSVTGMTNEELYQLYSEEIEAFCKKLEEYYQATVVSTAGWPPRVINNAFGNIDVTEVVVSSRISIEITIMNEESETVTIPYIKDQYGNSVFN